jgi:hypothetical protein
MEDVGIYGMITPGTILFCVSAAGLLFTLIWLVVGIARRKKREARIAREAMAGSAAFRRTDSAVSSVAGPGKATELAQTQGVDAQAQTEIVAQQVGPAGSAAKQNEQTTESMFDQAGNTARSLAATEIVADGRTEGFADSLPAQEAYTELVIDESRGKDAHPQAACKYCENCGEKMKTEDRFCARCGADMI